MLYPRDKQLAAVDRTFSWQSKHFLLSGFWRISSILLVDEDPEAFIFK